MYSENTVFSKSEKSPRTQPGSWKHESTHHRGGVWVTYSFFFLSPPPQVGDIFLGIKYAGNTCVNCSNLSFYSDSHWLSVCSLQRQFLRKRKHFLLGFFVNVWFPPLTCFFCSLSLLKSEGLKAIILEDLMQTRSGARDRTYSSFAFSFPPF